MTSWGPGSVEQWCEACAADPALAAFARDADVRFALAGENCTVGFTIRHGAVLPGAEEPAFTLRAPALAWSRYFSAEVSAPYQNWFGMQMRCEDVSVDGDELRFAQHAHLVRRVLETGRRLCGATEREPAPVEPPKAHLRGGYVRITVGDEPCDIYYEQTGQGPDLLLLHTAGADGRQYHGVMAEHGLRSRYRMTAFDLPGHGRSDPLNTHLDGTYSLTTESYATVVLAVADALGLRTPVVCGSSMAGQICLDLAWRVPDRIGGVVACEAADRVPGRTVGWARHPLVNQALFVPEWIHGLSSPTSPRRWRDRIWWQYSQGGYATFAGDIDFYSGDWDGRDKVTEIDTDRCPVVMMTGEFDYSCTPEMSRATCDKIDGAHFRRLPGLGHFPMAENPPVFATHLSDALDHIGV
ncbi:alpha/beta hydrolase [Saccharomonospora piscinae]|uniref:alpha/beta fold hydrolase n=1 Tax=Saccharomonospora piscinae TaxID=687388 RepID=UPI0011059EBF|nr:alpha/beta hydrolase [Saccharomonospora piscinae]TLW94580.1 alpha/beta hydrolase [Saccharomonospora piscinae]